MISVFIDKKIIDIELIPLCKAAFLERLKKIMEGNDLEEKRNRLRVLQKRRLENLLGRGRAKEIKKETK
jgi:hypothetical protein